jgi:diadenylate cyclase
MAVIAVYIGDEKHPLEPSARLLSRANQALQTLERYRSRLDAVAASLSALEVEDLVTLRDVVSVLQRTEMVRRIADEIEVDVIELGVDGRLIMLQLEELLGGVYDDGRQVVRDYFNEEPGWELGEALSGLADYGTEELLDLKAIADMLHLEGDAIDLDRSVTPRGYRLLSKVPRLPETVVDNIVRRFGNLQKIMRATTADLEQVEGVGASRARAIKEGLARLAETSILERYNSSTGGPAASATRPR